MMHTWKLKQERSLNWEKYLGWDWMCKDLMNTQNLESFLSQQEKFNCAVSAKHFYLVGPHPAQRENDVQSHLERAFRG